MLLRFSKINSHQMPSMTCTMLSADTAHQMSAVTLQVHYAPSDDAQFVLLSIEETQPSHARLVELCRQMQDIMRRQHASRLHQQPGLSTLSARPLCFATVPIWCMPLMLYCQHLLHLSVGTPCPALPACCLDRSIAVTHCQCMLLPLRHV